MQISTAHMRMSASYVQFSQSSESLAISRPGNGLGPPEAGPRGRDREDDGPRRLESGEGPGRGRFGDEDAERPGRRLGWRGDNGPGIHPGSALQVAAPAAATQATTAADAVAATEGVGASSTEQGLNSLEPKWDLLRGILEAITGKLMELFDSSMLSPQSGDAPATTMSTGSVPTDTAAAPAPSTADAPTPASTSNLLQVQRTSEYAEFESLRFQASGQIQTSDGQELSFSIELNMQRAFVERSSSQIVWGEVAQLKDPLVVNFDNQGTRLSPMQTSFDIDADDQLDRFAGLAPGQALLVLDSNGNGRIDNGSEVIGALSGDAFADLRDMDDDGNGFIDAGDEAYAQLGLWRPGEDDIRSLKDADVAALATQSLETPMQLDADGVVAGEVRRTSFYLDSSGQPGITQQIDLMT